jgi:ribosomal protein L37AE/L43A
MNDDKNCGIAWCEDCEDHTVFIQWSEDLWECEDCGHVIDDRKKEPSNGQG